MAFDDTSSFMIMDFQLSGSRWEQIMVLLDNSIRFSMISRRILTSRSSVIVLSRKSSRISRWKLTEIAATALTVTVYQLGYTVVSNAFRERILKRIAFLESTQEVIDS